MAPNGTGLSALVALGLGLFFFFLQEFRKAGAKGTFLMAMHCYWILL